MAPEVSQRRLPRFSLRSLILLVVLAGSGYGLWARWEPWIVVHSWTDDSKGYVSKGYVYRAEAALEGTRVLSESTDGTLSIWSANDHRKLASIRGYQVTFGQVSVDPSKEPDTGNGLFITSLPSHFKSVPANVRKEFTIRLPGHRFAQYALSESGLRLATAHEDRTVRLWDLLTGERILTVKQERGSWISAVAISADDQLLVTGDYEGAVCIWDVESGKLRTQQLKATGQSVVALHYFSEFQAIAAMFADRKLDPETMPHRYATDVVISSPHYTQRLPNSRIIGVSPDGRLIIMDNSKLQLIDWNIRKGKIAKTSSVSGSLVRESGLSPDGTKVLHTTGKNPGKAQILSAKSGAILAELEGAPSWGRGYQFSSDSSRIILYNRAWKVATGRKLPAMSMRKHLRHFYSLDARLCVAIYSRPMSTRRGDQVNDTRPWIQDVETGSALSAFNTPFGGAQFFAEGTKLLTCPGEDNIGDKLSIWQRRRPEYWWGVAWLPEFWLTLVLSTALLWSIRRDRLNLKTAAEPNSYKASRVNGK